MEKDTPLQEHGSLASIAGALASSLLASLCCLGPLVLGALGVGGAGALWKLERYRTHFSVATLALLGAGFYFTYRRTAEVDGCACALPPRRRLGRALLWLATALVIAIWAFPYVEGLFG